MTSSNLMTLTPFKELSAMPYSSHCNSLKLFHQWNFKNSILTSTWYFTNCVNIAKWSQIYSFIPCFPQVCLISLSLVISYINCSLSRIFHLPFPSSFHSIFLNLINPHHSSWSERHSRRYGIIMEIPATYKKQFSISV